MASLSQMSNADEYCLNHALKLARQAENLGEVPVGAVLVLENIMIAEGWNQPIQSYDPTAHAEILALRQGALHLQNYRLINTTLYVTLEPCMMCIGAIIHARVKRLVFGAFDSKIKINVRKDILNLMQCNHLNHRISIEGGVLADPCGTLLQNFFQTRRSGVEKS